MEFDRVVPPSGNVWVAGRQFWLGPARARTVIRFWADCQLIHLSADGARIKTVRSHVSVVEPPVVIPVDVFEGRDLDLLGGAPGAAWFAQFGLEQADHRLGES